MKAVSPERQTLLIKSMQSTLSKLENAYKNMIEKGSNATLVKKRLDAVKIALDSLENAWYGADFSYEKENILEARKVIIGILPSVEKQHENAKEGSPQKTLLERRIASIEAAIEALDVHTVNFK
ncbi:hypothetical protein ACFW1P_06030 [Paenibacillus sp. NPDC058910]|uniref:hypothetical protein n=1 Tax=unclassified Paenibacillus TaxID=185978 RepID=UPI0036CFEAF6